MYAVRNTQYTAGGAANGKEYGRDPVPAGGGGAGLSAHLGRAPRIKLDCLRDYRASDQHGGVRLSVPGAARAGSICRLRDPGRDDGDLLAEQPLDDGLAALLGQAGRLPGTIRDGAGIADG